MPGYRSRTTTEGPLAIGARALWRAAGLTDEDFGKPIVVTRPVAPEADVDERGYLGSAEWLTSDGARDVVAVLDRVLTDEAALERLQHWSNHHFGDTSHGASTSCPRRATPWPSRARTSDRWSRCSAGNASRRRSG